MNLTFEIEFPFEGKRFFSMSIVHTNKHTAIKEIFKLIFLVGTDRVKILIIKRSEFMKVM